MLNKTALSLQRQRGRRWCILPGVRRGRGEEEHGAIPSWHVHVHVHLLSLIWWERWKYTSLVIWGNPPGQAWGQHLRLGCDSGKRKSPQVGYCGWGLLQQRGLVGSSQLLLFPLNTTLCFSTFSNPQFPSLLLFSHPICLHSTSHSSVCTEGTRQTPRGKCQLSACPVFSPNVMWGYRISHHITAAFCSLQCHGYGSLPAPAANLSFQGALCHGYFKHLMQGF